MCTRAYDHDFSHICDSIKCSEIKSIKGQDVLPFLLDKLPDEVQNGVKPSEMFAALMLSTEGVLAKLRSPLRKYKIGSKGDAFVRCPEAIIFQNFELGHVYNASLSITNQRGSPQNLKLCFETSKFFSLSGNPDQNKLVKLNPGLPQNYKITFIPTDAQRDFFHIICFSSDDEQFSVPIFALGSNPIVNIPDIIILPPTVIKVATEQTIVVKNTGNMDFNFSQVTEKPIFTNLVNGILPPNEIFELTYRCYPIKTGHYKGKIKIYFRHDFCLLIDIECEVGCAQLNVVPQYLSFDDTYMGLTSKKILTLHNQSDFTLLFAWKINDRKEEKERIFKLKGLMEDMKNYEQTRCEKLEYMGIVDREDHEKIYEKIFVDEANELRHAKEFLYRSNFFDIIPKIGKVLPRTQFEFIVIFTPEKNIPYESSAFLDIAGVEKRIKTSFLGYGIGPLVELVVKDLDIGKIYLTDKHQYELVIANKGTVPATVTFQVKNCEWGGSINCSPESLKLEVNATKMFLITFYSKVEGEFIETLHFKVEESEEYLQCLFRGNVICPLLRCIPDSLDFGMISAGVSSTMDLELVNESRVAIEYDFQLHDSGTCYSDKIRVVPSQGKVPHFSKLTVQVSLFSETSIKFKTDLHLVMWNSKNHIKSIKLKATCSCPSITCNPDIINIKFCFINYLYTRTIKLQNSSASPGYVEFLEQKMTKDDEDPIKCTPNQTKLYFEAHETKLIELKIVVSKLGSYHQNLYFSVTGGVVLNLCSVICNGQGPVVSYHPDEVNFGTIEVLKKCERKLTIVNDSPIPATVQLQCKENTTFQISETPDEFELLPDAQYEITIWAELNTPGKHSDIIHLEVKNSDGSMIKVSAEGKGTSILCEPQLAPLVNFGLLLTYKPFVHVVKITNKGVLPYKLVFTKRSSIRSLKEIAEDDTKSNLFTIEPNSYEIHSGESQELTIKSVVKTPKTVSEEYFCHALIGKSPVIRTIFNFTLQAEFVDPQFSFSKREMDFDMHFSGDQSEGKLEDMVRVDNNTGIPLEVRFTVDDEEDNFTLIHGHSGWNSIEKKPSSTLSVKYTPNITEKRIKSQNARVIVEYQDHPKTDIINLHGVVMFPTIKLYPDKISFECVPCGSTCSQILIIQNVSAMIVKYEWLWLEESVAITELEPHKETPELSPLFENKDNNTDFMAYIDDIGPMDVEQTRSSTMATSPTEDSQSNISFDKKTCLDEMRNIMSSVLSSHFPVKENLLTIPNTKSDTSPISKILSLEPRKGILGPNEYTIITIGFNPDPETEISAAAICKVEGGEEEILEVTGKSSKLRYELDKLCVNFENQVFCDLCSNYLTVNNTGRCTLNFKVSLEERVKTQLDYMDVNPKCGSIFPGEIFPIKVDYLPGIPGIFNKRFILELGYLKAVSINVRGYAVLNQAYLELPRPVTNLSVEDCYKAISWITPEYLESVQKNGNLEVDDNPNDLRQFLEENDWVYISYNDLYPTLIDISMAMERMEAYNTISKSSNLVKESIMSEQPNSIPQFFPSSYVIDFGYVVREVPVCYTVKLLNYGPLSIDIKLLEDNKRELAEKELKIEFKPRLMAPNELMLFSVVFSPTTRKYPELNKNLEAFIRLRIKRGPIITIKILAEVTLPVINILHEELHFNNVYCGDVLRKSIILSNDGNVTSKWTAVLLKPTKKRSVNFLVIPNNGQLEPGQKSYLDIYFMPADLHPVKQTLRIDVEWNSESLLLVLYGEGLEAHLTIEPTKLNFAPTISYFETSLCFAVHNAAEIPMEFYFSSLDSDSEYEKNLVDIYLKYKNLKYVFGPLRQAGHPLPVNFLNTYNFLVEKLREKMLSVQKLDDAVETVITEVSNGESNDLLLKYSPKEVYSLLLEYVGAEGFDNESIANPTMYHLEETSENIEIIEPAAKTVDEDTERNGAVFIFHGAPNTDYLGGANQAGIVLSIPVYSIDRLIIEALIENSSSIATDIKNAIETAFSAISDVNAISLLESLENEDCEYDKLMEKINFVLTAKPKKKDKKSPIKDKKSQGSSEKNQSKGKPPGDNCFLDIQLDSLVELLKPKIKVLNNLIIESLHSTFIKYENQALNMVLRAAGSVQFINIVVFSYTIKDIIKNEENRLQAEKADTFQTKEVIFQEKSATVETASNRKANQSADGKMSKTSADKKKGIDISKKVLQSLNKAFKSQLEDFDNLFQEIVHVGQYWDKKNQVLKKQFSPGSKKESSTKDSARTLKNSVKKGSSSLTLEENSDYGLHMWIILNACNDRGIDYRHMIGNSLRTDAEIQKILADIEENKKPKFEEFDTNFTVISKPEQYRNEPSGVFKIKNFQDVENVYPAKSRSKSGSSIKVRRRRGSKSSKRSVDSRSGADTVISFAKAESDVEFFPKMVLEPGSQAKYLVTFAPRICGLYKYQYSLETTRTTRPYNVSCKAVCELPKIEMTPEFMFPKTLESYKEKASYDHFVYIKDQRIFDFGSVIAGSTSLRLCYSSTILLRNISSTTCDIYLGLWSDLFEITPANLVIVPKSEAVVTILTTPSTVGTITCEMFISIKDNPRVETFTLAYSCSKLELSVSPKLVNFDKVPLYYTAKRTVRLTNSSPINLRWELSDTAWATEIFEIPDQSGFLELYSFSDIIFKFHPTEELSLSKKYLQIKLYDVNCSSTEPCLIETVGFHADSVDYNLDLLRHIEYGEVKGGVESKTTYAIANKGKHEVLLKIEVANNPLENINYVREYFKIKPLELSIGAQKTENISILLHPKSNFSVENLFLFVVSIVENFDAAQAIKAYKVYTSITSTMPCYDICPPTRLSFGDVPLQNSKKLLIDITNNGRFSFGFTILNYAKVLEAQKRVKLGGKSAKDKKVGTDSATTESKTNKKPGKKENSKATTSEISKRSKGNTTKESSSKAEKRKPIKITKIDVGGFVVSPAAGIVYPNENIIIEVEFAPAEARDYKEQILVKISEIEELEKNKIITLTATACEPKIDLKSLEHIFMEQNVVTNVGDFVIPKQVDGCCVFVLAEQTLYFKQICLHEQFSTSLHLKNIGSVIAHLSVKVEDFGKSVFSLSESNIFIEPYTEGTLQVTFSPNSLEVFNGTLQISTNSSTDKLIVYLIGEACLPRIKLIVPSTDNNEASIIFGPICVGYNAFKRFCVKNVGPIKAKLITELSEGNDQLTIVPADDCTWKNLIKDEVNIQNNLVLSLLAGDVASFDIWYTPSKEGSIDSAIILHTISNPYETIKIKIDALGYNSNIVMEGLTPLKLNRSVASDPSIINKNSIGYLLDLGYKQLNKLYKTSFLVKNRSTENTYKFRFYCSTMVFSPEVGHLKPHVTKEIIVLFKATQPVMLENEEVTCYINKIEYVNPNDNPLSWDDRQKCVYWTTESEPTSNNSMPYSTISIQEEQQLSSDKHGNIGSDKNSKFAPLLRKNSGPDVNKAPIKTKVVVEGTEPEIITIPESFDVISVFLRVAADYAKYECLKNDIIFEDSFITEEKIEEFEIRNVGSVELSITWHITDENEINCIRKSNSDTKINFTCWDYEDTSLKSVTTISLISSSNSDKIESFLPFSIVPEKVDISPRNSTKFTVLFSPKQEGSFKGLLTSNITSLDPSFDEITIRICANALPTPLYFELENGSICNKDVVLQFENIGVGTESTKHIFLVNPTVNKENFEITPVDTREFSHFHCNKLTGEILPNKKADVLFNFHSPTYGRFKENYLLKIIENGVQKLIHLQGHCREPVVYFDENNIKLKLTVPHAKTSKIVKLINEENFLVNFKFVKKTFFSENQQDKLDITPITGRLESQSDCDIKVTFSTVNAISTNFHVKCLVEKLKSPLNLLVGAAAVSVKATVSFVSKNGEMVYLGEDRVNVIDMCRIIKGNKEKIQFQLTNQGTTGIFYEWEFDKKTCSLFKISFTSENGFINSGNTSSIDLVLEPLRKGTLKDFKIKLNIMYGPTYIISLNATVTNPNCKFSFERYNFGYCFVQKGETSFYNATLSFKNLENTKIFLENVSEKTSYLSLDYYSGFVSSGEVKNIKINFHPQVKGQYSSTITFVVSGWKHDILVTGEGVNLMLDLCNSLDRLISFGDVVVNSTKKYRVSVTNKSLAMLNVRFDLYDNLMALQKTTSKLEDCTMQMPVVPPPPEKTDKKNKGSKKNEKPQHVLTIEKSGPNRAADHKSLTENQEDIEKRLKEEDHKKEILKCFSIVPNTFMDIPPKAKRYFDIVVQPLARFCFNEKIYFETQNRLEPLCTIQGKSIAPDFSLDKTELVFSGVIIGCRSSQTIVIRNKGDVIGSFHWRFDDLKQEEFSLNPKEGFVLPYEDVKINIAFAPKKVKCQIKTKVRCHFKEINRPLKLQLSGNAVKIPEPASTITLSCGVRETVVDRSVLITNPTLQVWLVYVESWNKTFSTPEQLTILPSSSAPLPISYCPKKMTEVKTDEGKIFIKYPDGGGILYNVIGKAGPPALKKRIEKEIYCKTNYYEDLMIENWLGTKQIFNVETELLSPITAKMLYKILGSKTIELKGSEKKLYKWGVHVVNEGPIEFRVTFKNTDSGEYEYFELLYRVVSSDDEEIIYFKGKVREQLTRFINLENPINVPVTYNLHGAEKYVTYSSYVTVEPCSVTKVMLTCLMKNAETVDTSITAKCEELGMYKFNLNIVAEPPLEEQCILFNCELGSKDTKTILFENASDKVADFTYAFEDERFYIEKCPSIPAGETSRIIIGFEPFSLEPAQARLFLTSSATGLYIYPLNGSVKLPSPKGPFYVKSTNSAVIEFKNPFKEDQRFECVLQPEIFSCDFNPNEVVKARKPVKLLISANFGTESRPNCCITGQLTICATNEPKIEWKYYLQYDP